MSDNDNKTTAPFLEFAPRLMLQFCGALVALSLALVQIGFDDVVDAYAQSIIADLENGCDSEYDFTERLEALEAISHEPTTVKIK